MAAAAIYFWLPLGDFERPAYYDHMYRLIQQQLPDIRRIASQHKAMRLDLFGSAVSNDSDTEPNDLDFIVEFEPLAPGEYTKHFFELREELEQLTGYSVDLVVDSAIRNPFFRASVDQTRLPIYAR